MKKEEWKFNGKTKKSFMVRCLQKPFGIATLQRYEKGDPSVDPIETTPFTKLVKPPIKYMWMITVKKGKSFSGYIDKKLFGLMNYVIIENLGIVNIKFKTFHLVE